MIVDDESLEPVHRKSTVQGRLEPIQTSGISATPSTSTSPKHSSISLPLSPKISDAQQIPTELKPVRVPQGSIARRSRNHTDITNDKTRQDQHTSELAPPISTTRRYSIQVPCTGFTSLHKQTTEATDKFHPIRRDRAMSIDQRFDTCAQFVESVRKNLRNS